MKILISFILLITANIGYCELVESKSLKSIGGSIVEYEEGSFDLVVPKVRDSCLIYSVKTDLTENGSLVLSSELRDNLNREDEFVSTIIFDPLSKFVLSVTLLYKCENTVKIIQLGSFAEIIKGM
ncbi:hypothetical protein [Paraglaciecola sp. 25GB23A]|uniref:hypothetical protein n=1 Tax=Paraglaciecola sp. 25GB23A TaxID=3156068 RepID=UPI0032AFBEB6